MSAGVMLTLLTEIIGSGSGARAVTGAPPTSFADFAKATASAWAEQVAR